MIDFGGESGCMEEFKKLVPEYPLHFLDLSAFEHFENFKTELRPLLELFQRRSNKKEFIKYIEENQEHWKMNDESWFMLSQLTNSRTLRSLIKEKSQEAKAAGEEGREGKSMLKALDDLVDDAKAEGKSEDILELLEDYGEVPKELRDRIFDQKDMATLQRWHKLAARAGSIQEFMKGM